jgi:hypothetical protein
MERLTKKELRPLLECIRECYSIRDVETFKQRVISRLSKIVPPEFNSYDVVNPRRRWNACATYRLAITSLLKIKYLSSVCTRWGSRGTLEACPYRCSLS